MNICTYLWVYEESESWPRLDNVPHLHPLLMGHISQDREDDGGREEAGEGVDAADEDCILVAIVVELVITAECQQGPDPHSV